MTTQHSLSFSVTKDHGASAHSLLARQGAAAGAAEGAVWQGLYLVRRGFWCPANSKGENNAGSFYNFHPAVLETGFWNTTTPGGGESAWRMIVNNVCHFPGEWYERKVCDPQTEESSSSARCWGGTKIDKTNICIYISIQFISSNTNSLWWKYSMFSTVWLPMVTLSKTRPYIRPSSIPHSSSGSSSSSPTLPGAAMLMFYKGQNI